MSHVDQFVHGIVDGGLALFAYRLQTRHGEPPAIRQRKNFEHKAYQFISDLVASQELSADHCEVAVLFDTHQSSVIRCESLHFNVILRDRIIFLGVFVEIIDMDLKGICISTGSACNGSSDEISHVLQAIRLSEDYALGTIRISLGKNNTESEVLELVESLAQIIEKSKNS